MNEMETWLKELLEFADGSKQWDTSCIWVCEAHPTMPYEMGYSFDCQCGAPGMPPYTPGQVPGT